MKLSNKLFIIGAMALSMSLVGCETETVPKGYSLIEYADGDLIIEMQAPFFYNEGYTDWNDVKVDNLINDIYNFFQSDRKYDTYSLWVRFVSYETDKYGNTTKKYDENHFLTKISVEEARKYKSTSYFNATYQIPAKIIDASISDIVSKYSKPYQYSQVDNQVIQQALQIAAQYPGTFSTTKCYDWIMSNMANPKFNGVDFRVVGDLTLDNTQFKDLNYYLNAPRVRNSQMFKDKNGQFNEDNFKVFYVQSAKKFLDFADLRITDNYEYSPFDLDRPLHSLVKDR